MRWREYIDADLQELRELLQQVQDEEVQALCDLIVDARRIFVVGQHEQTMLTIDGQEGERLAPGDEIVVGAAGVTTKLVRRLGWSFYDVLRRKFHEAGLRGENG